jgi:uncharacterized membrane protein YdjX (TVP38/TMEM64 family)
MNARLARAVCFLLRRGIIRDFSQKRFEQRSAIATIIDFCHF